MTRSYRIPWLALAMGIGYPSLFLVARWINALHFPMPACPLKALLGIPCATCGLTRCFLALGAGRWKEAFYWHPVAVALLALYPLAVLWDLNRVWKNEPMPELPDSWVPRIAVLVVLVGTWILQVARGI